MTRILVSLAAGAILLTAVPTRAALNPNIVNINGLNPNVVNANALNPNAVSQNAFSPAGRSAGGLTGDPLIDLNGVRIEGVFLPEAGR